VERLDFVNCHPPKLQSSRSLAQFIMTTTAEPHDSDAPVAGVVPVHSMKGDDEKDTLLLQQMSRDAEAYLRSFSWCGDVQTSFFGGGVGGLFAVFLFNIRATRPDVYSWIWVVVGDIPSAYLPIEDAKTPAEVFRTYLSGMRRWVDYARREQKEPAGDDVPPMNVPATPEWAEKLEKRLNSLCLIIQPFFGDEDASNAVH
jgi:hypothetical protein